MSNYKTIYVSHNGVNYSFDIEIESRVAYQISRRSEDSDYWERIGLEQVPDKAQILMYQKLRKAQENVQLP